MKIPKNELTRKEILIELLDLAFCWNNHILQEKSNLQYIYAAMTGIYLHFPIDKKILSELRELVNEKTGYKAVYRFKVPEMIQWCGCEPKYSLLQSKQVEYRDLLVL